MASRCVSTRSRCGSLPTGRRRQPAPPPDSRPAVEAVLLDALGTLVLLEPPWDLLRATLDSRHGIAITDQDAHRAMLAEMSYYRKHHRSGADAASLEALRAACAGVLRDQLPALAALSPDHLRDALLDSIRFTPYPDAAPVLGTLRSLGIRSAVVSNWDCSLPSVLNDLGLGGMLDAVVTSAQVGAAKPAAAIFEAALQEVRCSPEKALFVGDSQETDIAGARAAGMRAILIDRGRAPAAGAESGRIYRLDDLLQLMSSQH